MPRVVAGQAKGIILKAPKGFDTRPTSDKTKEAIFSSILEFVPEANFLDLFAGTGQMGIEALSRGAKEAVFVDKSRASIASLRENLEKTRMAPFAKVMQRSAIAAVKEFIKKTDKFDIIYFDPPYKNFHDLLKNIGEENLHEILNEDGLIILEEDSHNAETEEGPLSDELFILLKRCKYGQAMVSFYQKNSSGETVDG